MTNISRFITFTILYYSFSLYLTSKFVQFLEWRYTGRILFVTFVPFIFFFYLILLFIIGIRLVLLASPGPISRYAQERHPPCHRRLLDRFCKSGSFSFRFGAKIMLAHVLSTFCGKLDTNLHSSYTQTSKLIRKCNSTVALVPQVPD